MYVVRNLDDWASTSTNIYMLDGIMTGLINYAVFVYHKKEVMIVICIARQMFETSKFGKRFTRAIYNF